MYALELRDTQNKFLQDVWQNPHQLFTLADGVELW
jgi:hypothetical protein